MGRRQLYGREMGRRQLSHRAGEKAAGWEIFCAVIDCYGACERGIATVSQSFVLLLYINSTELLSPVYC